jgi:hypothetical protein
MIKFILIFFALSYSANADNSKVKETFFNTGKILKNASAQDLWDLKQDPACDYGEGCSIFNAPTPTDEASVRNFILKCNPKKTSFVPKFGSYEEAQNSFWENKKNNPLYALWTNKQERGKNIMIIGLLGDIYRKESDQSKKELLEKCVQNYGKNNQDEKVCDQFWVME